MNAPLNLLGISGSLRQASVNTGLLRAAGRHLPAGANLTLHDLRDIPLYDGDVEARGIPASVLALKAAIGEADAVLITTPEYNYSFSGVLKNALDWVSRPRAESPFTGKPVAIAGAGGKHGTSRAQYQLRQVLTALEALTMPLPELMVMRSWEKFDAAGELTDAARRRSSRRFSTRSRHGPTGFAAFAHPRDRDRRSVIRLAHAQS